jgi:hypothetical protein
MQFSGIHFIFAESNCDFVVFFFHQIRFVQLLASQTGVVQNLFRWLLSAPSEVKMILSVRIAAPASFSGIIIHCFRIHG